MVRESNTFDGSSSFAGVGFKTTFDEDIEDEFKDEMGVFGPFGAKALAESGQSKLKKSAVAIAE